MLVFLARHKNTVVFICFCIASLIFSWFYSAKYESDRDLFVDFGDNQVKSHLFVLLIPNQILERVVSFITSKIADVGHFFVYVFRKPIQEDEFRSIQNMAETLSRQLDEEKAKNERLERLWKFSNGLTDVNPSFRFVPASVISVEPTDWFRYVTINKGKKHGLTMDMAVITQAMYPPPKSMTTTKLMTGVIVGKIKSVQSNSAKVQLITDRLSAVAVTIGNLQDLILLRGQSESEKCTIDEIPATTHDMLYEGDAVIVDDRSTIYPPGMLVGWISSIDKRTNFCHIEVQPAFKFSRLREVIVVLNASIQ